MWGAYVVFAKKITDASFDDRTTRPYRIKPPRIRRRRTRRPPSFTDKVVFKKELKRNADQ